MLLPIVEIFVNSSLGHLTAFQYLKYLKMNNDVSYLVFFLGLYPVAGAAVYAVKRWSYFTFIAATVLTFAFNLQAWQQFPEVFPLSELILTYLVNLGFVSYFLIPNVKAAYFDPRLRWWESKPRFHVDIVGRIKGAFGDVPCRIMDISEGGVFLQVHEDFDATVRAYKELLGAAVELQFAYGRRTFHLHGDVVHLGGARIRGIGVRFAEVTSLQSREIGKFIRAIELLGFDRDPKKIPVMESFTIWAEKVFASGEGLVPELPSHYGRFKKNQQGLKPSVLSEAKSDKKPNDSRDDGNAA
jgi:hypothetical protein